MGYIYEGASGLYMQTLQFISHFQTEFRIQVRQRLIHEQYLGFRCQCSGNGNSLLLSTGQFCGITVHEHSDLNDTRYSAYRQVYLFLGIFSDPGYYLATGYDFEFLVKLFPFFLMTCQDAVQLGSQFLLLLLCGTFFVCCLMELVIIQFLCSIDRNGVIIDQLQIDHIQV